MDCSNVVEALAVLEKESITTIFAVPLVLKRLVGTETLIWFLAGSGVALTGELFHKTVSLLK